MSPEARGVIMFLSSIVVVSVVMLLLEALTDRLITFLVYRKARRNAKDPATGWRRIWRKGRSRD